MQAIKIIIEAVIEIMSRPFDLFGFRVSFMGIFIASILITIVGRFIWGLFE